MTETGSHPAVFAGLLGGAAWSVPTLALAVTADGVVEAVKGSLLLQFTLGCALGAGLAGAIIFVQDRLDAREAPAADEVEEEEEPVEDDLWSESLLNLVRAQVEEIDDDPTGDLGRFRTGQITIDLPIVEEEVAVAAAEPRRPRHFKHSATPVTANAAAPKRAGRHFAQTERQESLVAALVSSVSAPEPSRGRHFATSVVVTPIATPVAVPVAVEAKEPEASQTTGKLPKLDERGKSSDDQAARLRRRELLANLPSFDTHEVIESKIPAAAVAEPAAPVVEKVPAAETSVATPSAATDAKKTKTKSSKSPRKGITGRIMVRMAERTRSVREVLADRLSDDAMNGIPVIERADGSVSDVAPTWFDHTFVPAIASLTGITGKLDDTVEHTASDLGNKSVVSKAKVDAEPSRSAYISRHVAEVNVGMFPERRSADELEHNDVWEEALAAMGETIARETPVFQDVVGGPTTIDDPDGLEGPTGFIPFRVPAAHPEVVDTETYVDYLLRDELSQNSAEVVRNSVHAHLRVIEGGTSPRLVRRRPSDTGKLGTGKLGTGKVNTGRHFAQHNLAAQA